MTDQPTTAILVDNVTKSFGETKAVDAVTLNIEAGQFFSMLGPSGCGKTTTLRMIAGFEQPTSGRILLRGEDVTWVPPARRQVNMVFQEYGLFPHMTVGENIAFGLKLKRVNRAEIRRRVGEVLETVQLVGLAGRRPAQLSGGQQQRVALARALVNRPAALLLDEPLGALDLKLRKEMQLELKSIQSRTETTFVYVTHDQEEALTMSDRIAVMRDGVVEQEATPFELYERPATAFVAGFIGISNLIEIRVDERADGCLVMRIGDSQRVIARDDGSQNGSVRQMTVRPEKIKLTNDGLGENASRVAGTVVEVVYLGSMTQIIVELSLGGRLVVNRLNDDNPELQPRLGESIDLFWAREHSYLIGSNDTPH